MKRLMYLGQLGMIGVLLLFSCSVRPISKPPGELRFQFSTGEEMSALYAIEDADALIVSIEDTLGNPTYTDMQITLYNLGGSYVSDPLPLELGDYELTQFWVIDVDVVPAEVIFLTPEEGSERAYLVNDPVPISFTIIENDATTVSPEVLDTEGYTPEQFGYTGFDLNVVETFHFQVSVFIAAGAEFELTDASISVTDGVEVLYSGGLMAETNLIEVRDGYEDYDLLVEKAGYESHTDSFSAAELKLYSLTPLIITLNESP